MNGAEATTPAMNGREATPAPPPTKIQYPPGYRFMPTDAELIVEYLLKKINNEPIPIAEIKETYLRLVSPKELTEKCPKLGDNELYFFTPRDRKYPNGKRPNRGSQSGYWKATGADKSVMYKGQEVGVRKALVFYEGEPQKGRKTNWIMHEYRVEEHAHPVPKKTNTNDTKVKGRKRVRGCDEPPKKTTTNDMRLDDWVLCKLYEKSSRVTNKQNAKAKAEAEADTVEDEDEDENESNEAASGVDNTVVSNYANVQVPENHQYSSSYDYHNNNFGDCSSNPLLFEEVLPHVLMNGPLQSYNYDYWMTNSNPVEQANNAFGNMYPCVNEEAVVGSHQQQADPIMWNEAFLSANTYISNNYCDPIYRHIDVEGDNKRVRYNF